MPRKKNWRKSKSRRVVLGQQEVLERISYRQNPASVQVLSPVSVQIQSPASLQANVSKSQKDLEKGNKQNDFTNKVSQKEHEEGRATATCIDLVLRQSTQSWNACQVNYGSCHQIDVRFPEQCRGFQCTGNALCMLSYSACRYK